MPAGMVAGLALAGTPAALAAPAFTPALAGLPQPALVAGPCTAAAQEALATGHDHGSVPGHQVACGIQRVGLDALDGELPDMPNAVLGSVAVRGTVAVAAVSYPEAGLLVFDLTDPAHPVLRGRYQSGVSCHGLLADTDCGVDVDLSPDGRRAYLGYRSDGIEPGDTPPFALTPGAYPALDVIDLANPAAPRVLQRLPIYSFGGLTAVVSFRVPDGPGSETLPRVPGEYVAVGAGGVGVSFFAISATGVATALDTIDLDDVSGLAVREDPRSGRTLLYAAGGFDTGFTIWDVTDPRRAQGRGEWDATPECARDHYAQAIDATTTADGRRVVALGILGLDYAGEQAAADQEQGCGRLLGLGDYAAPVFLVDVTDPARLAPAVGVDSESAEESSDIKALSARALLAVWSNAAGTPAGAAQFVPGALSLREDGRLVIAGMHGGLTVLDASEALAGRNVRPSEQAVDAVAPGARPVPAAPSGAPSFAGRLGAHPLLWDVADGPDGTLLVSDASGGVRLDRVVAASSSRGTKRPIAAPACADEAAPRSRLVAVRITHAGVRLSGRASDKGCPTEPGAIARVRVAVGRALTRTTCRFLLASGRLGASRPCRRPLFRLAKGTRSWRFSMRATLPRGSYVVLVRADDAAGNRERARGRRVRVR